jgi:hypothetical protein
VNLISLGFWISVGLAILKLIAPTVVTISWWLVAAPLLVAAGISIAIIVFAALVAIIIAAINNN